MISFKTNFIYFCFNGKVNFQTTFKKKNSYEFFQSGIANTVKDFFRIWTQLNKIFQIKLLFFFIAIEVLVRLIFEKKKEGEYNEFALNKKVFNFELISFYFYFLR